MFSPFPTAGVMLQRCFADPTSVDPPPYTLLSDDVTSPLEERRCGGKFTCPPGFSCLLSSASDDYTEVHGWELQGNPEGGEHVPSIRSVPQPVPFTSSHKLLRPSYAHPRPATLCHASRRGLIRQHRQRRANNVRGHHPRGLDWGHVPTAGQSWMVPRHPLHGTLPASQSPNVNF